MVKDFVDGLQSLVPFLQSYPLWVKSVVVAWIFLTAVMVVGFLFFRNPLPQPPKVLATAKPLQAITSTSDTASSNRATPSYSDHQAKAIIDPKNVESMEVVLTIQDYFSSLEKLRDRFLEKDEFIHGLQGKRVTWIGYVDSVAGAERTTITLVIVESKNSLKRAFVHFPQKFKAKLFSLRKGDKVIISGVYRTGTPNIPDIEADSIRVDS